MEILEVQHYDVVGAVGVLMLLYAYFQLQAGKMDILDLRYSVI